MYNGENIRRGWGKGERRAKRERLLLPRTYTRRTCRYVLIYFIEKANRESGAYDGTISTFFSVRPHHLTPPPPTVSPAPQPFPSSILFFAPFPFLPATGPSFLPSILLFGNRPASCTPDVISPCIVVGLVSMAAYPLFSSPRVRNVNAARFSLLSLISAWFSLPPLPTYACRQRRRRVSTRVHGDEGVRSFLYLARRVPTTVVEDSSFSLRFSGCVSAHPRVYSNGMPRRPRRHTPFLRHRKTT